MEQAGQAVDDAAITAAVKSKLLVADDLKAMEINVDTVGGEVTLSGTAPSDAARTHAEAIASEVDGVKEVHTTSSRSRTEHQAPGARRAPGRRRLRRGAGHRRSARHTRCARRVLP